VSADYSQIELRLLAEIADIPVLKQAFRDGLDIHAMTASEMFGVPIKDMPSEVRRRAKAINFGIIYGISAFGLANQLGIAREEASAYIKKYFERFPGIRAYMDETRDFCRSQRLCRDAVRPQVHYPDIKARNASVRSFNERAAINARLQGTAADIIRRAMIRMEDALAEKKALGADAAAGARRTDLRGARRRGRGDAAGGAARDAGRAVPGGAAVGAAAGRCAGGE
jgi:DNA polymerase-1